MILTQAEQFPLRVAMMRRAIVATNTDRIDRSDVIDDGRPLTDEEHRQLRVLVELASRITGAVIQPGDTGSGGPMFSDDSTFGPAIIGVAAHEYC